LHLPDVIKFTKENFRVIRDPEFPIPTSTKEHPGNSSGTDQYFLKGDPIFLNNKDSIRKERNPSTLNQFRYRQNKSFMNAYKVFLFRFIKYLMMTCGGLFLFILIFSFTTGPFWMYNWLGSSESDYHFTPANIIIMGGAGYPSESAMMRSYYAAKLGHQFPDAKIVVTKPAARGVAIEKTDAFGIRQDLMIRGIDSTRIILEIYGKNTREEAQNVLVLEPSAKNNPCVLVTAPEHELRSILTFRKLGYKAVGGAPTFNAFGPIDLVYKDNSLGGRNIPIAAVGNSIQLRYQFWNHLRYQVICYRELFALAWYKLRGWA
jgi:uncharacterized SAM-binding protein YcdF (DUF218 family)